MGLRPQYSSREPKNFRCFPILNSGFYNPEKNKNWYLVWESIETFMVLSSCTDAFRVFDFHCNNSKFDNASVLSSERNKTKYFYKMKSFLNFNIIFCCAAQRVESGHLSSVDFNLEPIQAAWKFWLINNRAEPKMVKPKLKLEETEGKIAQTIMD